mgnify:CR=1 FL=1
MAKRILFLSESGDIIGGGEYSLLLILREFDRARHEPVLLLPGHGDLEPAARSLGVETHVIDMPNPKHPLGPLWIASRSEKIAALIKKENISLVHANTNLRITPYSAAAARRARVPAVWHVRVIRPYPAGLDRLWFASFDRIVTNSESTKARFSSFPGAARKLVTVYNAVDTDLFHPAPADTTFRASLGAYEEKTILAGTAGRFTWEKGMIHFVEAANIIGGDGATNIRFAAAGDGVLREKCETALKSNNFVFPGRVPVQDLPSFMNALDILVLPSIEESFGRVLIEAMACGKPVVASNVGGIPEIVEHEKTGLLVPHSDPAALAVAIKKLAEDPAMRVSMGTAGRERVLRRFSLKEHTKALHDLYDDILSR